jgi:hypothetical protein
MWKKFLGDNELTIYEYKQLLSFPSISDTMDEVFWITNVELSSQYEEKFSKDDFSFGSNHFNFKIYVYNLTPYSVVSVSNEIFSNVKKRLLDHCTVLPHNFPKIVLLFNF